MSLLDQASLVITPNGYKESVLYSVVPNTTLGDMDVVRATTATRVNSAGLIESVGVNVPRIDYTNGSCPSLLVEPQRTNLLTYSEQFDDVDWLKFGSITVNSNTTISPNGTINADSLIPQSVNGTFAVAKVISKSTSPTSYTLSGYAKSSGYNYLILRIDQGDSNGVAIAFDINTGVISTAGATSGTGWLFNNANIVNTQNDWFRFSISFTTGSSSYLRSIIYVSNLTGDGFAVPSYLGTGTSGVYIWGAQLEAGSYATSYVPTVATSVTRNADVISKTGISSLIGQTEGTIFFDGIVNDIQNIFTNILNTNKTPSTSSQIALSKVKATNKFNFDQFYGDGTFERITLLSTNSFANGTRTKVAIRYKSGDFAMYINGNLEATSSLTFTNIGTKSELFLNDSETFFAYQENVSFNNAILFKTVLSNSELAQLTTL